VSGCEIRTVCPKTVAISWLLWARWWHFWSPNPQISASVHCTDVYSINSADVGALYVVNAFNYSIREQDSQCTYNVTLWRVRLSTAVVEKQVSMAYSECVSAALGIQHAMRMRHIVICSLSYSTILCYIFHKRYDFRKKKRVTEHKMCVFIFCTTFVCNISHSKKNYYMPLMYPSRLKFPSYFFFLFSCLCTCKITTATGWKLNCS